MLLYLEPKPVYAQPGQPDVDLPVSPSDAPVPSAAHDDSILRYCLHYKMHILNTFYKIQLGELVFFYLSYL